MPSIAATTTGMYSGLQPAITALMATFSAVTETERWAMNPTSCLPSSRAASSIAPTRSSVGGMTGRPSVHPCAKQNSMASPTSATRWRLDVSVTDMRASLRGTRYHPVTRERKLPSGACHSSMRTVTARVAPNVGMIAECLPGPPATMTIRSSGLAQSATSSASSRSLKRAGSITAKRSRFSGLKRSSLTRRPRRRRLVLGDAVRVLPGVAEGRAVLASRPRATDVLEGQTHRAPDHGVGAVALAERVGAGVDPEPRRDRTVDDEERRAGMRGRLDRVEVEARIGERTDRGDDDRQVLGQGARERRVDGDRLEGCHSLARYERRDHLGAVASEAPEDASHALLGRREHGQPVRPALGDGEVLKRVEIARRAGRCSGGRDGWRH